ncbi:hypothetical protein [Plantactinospora sonchi]|uniref:Uncharacterized protein n=1 Tax=Plantactinospora sonchi TaxID=1544735 RepID=A0ABU7S0A7_9ACTN
MKYAVAPSRWLIRLRSGTQLEVWANGYSVDEDHYVFGALMDGSPEELEGAPLAVWPPLQPGCFQILVARIPEAEVAEVNASTDVESPGDVPDPSDPGQ